MLRVFVYGTLKPQERYYPVYCQGRVKEACRGWVEGQLYALPLGYPAMIAGHGKVEGFLLTFSDQSILTNLDRLEGYQSERAPELNEYQRQKIIVYDTSRKPLGEAWAYFMTFEKVKSLGGLRIPSGWWTEDESRV